MKKISQEANELEELIAKQRARFSHNLQEPKPMSYSEFKTISEVSDRFQKRVDESKNLFADIPPVKVREFWQQILERNIPLASAINLTG